jgi:ABC-type lipoprotein release transport system permease subunit
MAVIRMLLGASFRHRWRSWLLLGLLIALVSGLVLTATATGRRAGSAFPRYEAAHGYDAFLLSINPITTLSALPEVTSATLVPVLGGVSPSCVCSHPISSSDFNVLEVTPKNLPRMVKLVAGRMPDQSNPNQVLASITMEQNNGVHVGTVIRVPLFTASQRSAALSGANVVPRGPTLSLHVVGIEAAELEFPGTGSPGDDLYSTDAFDRTYNANTVVLSSYYVRLRHGSADLPQFKSQAQALGAFVVYDVDTEARAIASSIHPQAVGWWILALLAALVGIIVVAQALDRQATVEADINSTLKALGVSRRQLVALSMARTLIIGIGGVIGGVAIAFLLSPLTLVGEVKLAELSTGFVFDAFVLVPGALAAIIIVLSSGLWPAIRTARNPQWGESAQIAHPSRIVAYLTGAGIPPSALIGIRHALERGRGSAAIPVRTALLGSILAVTALCATAVFGASLNHLTNTPGLYGQPYNLELNLSNGSMSAGQDNKLLSSLERGRAISDITATLDEDVRINRRIVDIVAAQRLRGQMLLTTVNGRLPAAEDEVALGATTMRQVGAHLGSLVRVSVPGAQGGSHTASYRVVGTAVFSPNAPGGLGTGALFTLEGVLGGRCSPGLRQRECLIQAVIGAGGSYVARAEPGPVGQAAISRLAREYPAAAISLLTPASLVSFGEAVNFPLLFGLILIAFGAATLLHVLVLSVFRRRREVGLLKALGFVRRQVAISVVWQTTTVALVGIVIGVPAGIIVGRGVWRLFANNLGVLPVPVVIAWVIVAVALGTLIVANVLAMGPALVASRSRAASLLKTE